MQSIAIIDFLRFRGRGKECTSLHRVHLIKTVSCECTLRKEEVRGTEKGELGRSITDVQ